MPALPSAGATALAEVIEAAAPDVVCLAIGQPAWRHLQAHVDPPSLYLSLRNLDDDWVSLALAMPLQTVLW